MRIVVENRRRYGFWNFVLDLLLIGITGGWWLVWILFRQLARR